MFDVLYKSVGWKKLDQDGMISHSPDSPLTQLFTGVITFSSLTEKEISELKARIKGFQLRTRP